MESMWIDLCCCLNLFALLRFRYVIIQGEMNDADDSNKERQIVLGVYSFETGDKICGLQGVERAETTTVAVSLHSDDPHIAIGYSSGQVRIFEMQVCTFVHTRLRTECNC